MPRLVVAALIFVCVAYYLYIPLSDKAEEPWKEHFTYAIFKVIGDISRVSSFFGFNEINTVRACLPIFTILNRMFSPNVEGIEEKRSMFDGVEVRIYYPPGSEDKLNPCIMYFHGGGWTYLDGDDHVINMKNLARLANVITVFVEYRKAPEHVFPAAFEDCFKATTYIMQNANKLRVDKNRIGLAGDSAGGNLALAVSLKLSEEKGNLPPLKLQGLIYPTIQALDFTLSAFETYNAPARMENTFVTKSLMIFWVNIYAFGHLDYAYAFANNSHISSATKKNYRKYVDPKMLPPKYQSTPNDDIDSVLPNVKEVEKILLNPYFAPLMMTDSQLKKQPKTLIVTCEIDGLRDEGFILSERMQRVNHQVKHEHYGGSSHGFVWLTYLKSYSVFWRNFTSFIKDNI